MMIKDWGYDILSASDVVAAIRSQNIQAAAGVVGASPGLAGGMAALASKKKGSRHEEENQSLV